MKICTRILIDDHNRDRFKLLSYPSPPAENELAGAKGTVNYQFRDPVQLTPLEGRKRFV